MTTEVKEAPKTVIDQEKQAVAVNDGRVRRPSSDSDVDSDDVSPSLCFPPPPLSARRRLKLGTLVQHTLTHFSPSSPGILFTRLSQVSSIRRKAALHGIEGSFEAKGMLNISLDSFPPLGLRRGASGAHGRRGSRWTLAPARAGLDVTLPRRPSFPLYPWRLSSF